LTGAALLAATVLLTAESTIATTDAVLLSATIAAQAVLLRAYLAARGGPKLSLGIAMAGWVAFGLGILLKGPVIFGMCGVTALALSLWDRDVSWLRALRPWRGIGLTLVIVLPWMIAIALRSHGDFYAQSLGHDFGGKLVSGEEAHGAWPGYFLALSSLSLWPATLFAIPAIGAAWSYRRDGAARFLLAWAGAVWLMVELVPTKLPHYVLPAYPALALLASFWALRGEPPVTRGQRAMLYAAAVQFALGLAALVAAPVVAMKMFGGGSQAWLVAWVAVGAIVGIGAIGFLLRHKNVSALACAVLAALVLYPALTAGTAPRLSTIWISSRAAAAVAKDKRPGDPPPVLAGYAEPSMIFLLGTQTRVTGGSTAAEVEAGEGGLALIADNERESFLSRLKALGGEAVKVDEISGLNYSRGRQAHLTFYRVAPVAQVTAPPPE
jgi:4-amino-4-deoxy-L-arabinose transferase-like glycosyltransferase